VAVFGRCHFFPPSFLLFKEFQEIVDVLCAEGRLGLVDFRQWVST
jgi:hypothetical protein